MPSSTYDIVYKSYLKDLLKETKFGSDKEIQKAFNVVFGKAFLSDWVGVNTINLR